MFGKRPSVVVPPGYEAVHNATIEINERIASQNAATHVEESPTPELTNQSEVLPVMSTTAPATPAKTNGFLSLLDNIGSHIKNFFTKDVPVIVTDATKVAQAVEPIENLIFPGTAGLYNSTVTAVANAENAALVAGQQTGTGQQKLALVVASIEGSFNSYWASLGNTTSPTQAQIEAYVNSVVASLNALGTVATAGTTASTSAS